MMQLKILSICTNDNQSLNQSTLQDEFLIAKHNIQLLNASINEGHNRLQHLIKKKFKK